MFVKKKYLSLSLFCIGCVSDLDPCINVTCDFHGTCKAFGPFDPRCICEPSCPSFEDPVCSSNGTTFDNKCKYRQEMCRLSSNQTIYHPGDCTGKFLCIMNFIHSTFNKFRAILRKLLDMEFVCLGRMVGLFSNKIYKDIPSAGAHQMEPPSLLIF